MHNDSYSKYKYIDKYKNINILTHVDMFISI